MPALPSVSKVLKTIIKYSSSEAAQDILNILFLAYAGTAPTDAQLVTLAGDILTLIGSDLVTMYPSVLSNNEVSLEDLSSDTAATGFNTGTNTGTRSGAPLGAGTALVIGAPIARRYRGGHPRSYLPWGTAADLTTQDQWGTTEQAAFLAAWVDFIGGLSSLVWSGGVSLTHVNVSYYQGFTPHVYPSGRYRNVPNLRVTPVVDPVIEYVCNPRTASQRRRNQQRSG